MSDDRIRTRVLRENQVEIREIHKRGRRGDRGTGGNKKMINLFQWWLCGFIIGFILGVSLLIITRAKENKDNEIQNIQKTKQN